MSTTKETVKQATSSTVADSDSASGASKDAEKTSD